MPLDEQRQYLDILGGNVKNKIFLRPESSEEAKKNNKTYSISLVYINKAKSYEGFTETFTGSKTLDLNTTTRFGANI